MLMFEVYNLIMDGRGEKSSDWNLCQTLSSVERRLKWLLCMSPLTTKVVYCLAKQCHHISLVMKRFPSLSIAYTSIYSAVLSIITVSLCIARCGIQDITMGNAVTFLSCVHRKRIENPLHGFAMIGKYVGNRSLTRRNVVVVVTTLQLHAETIGISIWRRKNDYT